MDLKYANLIFVEHEKLTEENELLKLQLDNYSILTSDLSNINSLQKIQLDEYQKMTNEYDNHIIALNKEIKKKNRTILGLEIGGITIGVGLLLLLLFK